MNATRRKDVEKGPRIVECPPLRGDASMAGAGEEQDVFLSHRFADRELARALHDRIEQLGYRCYVDWIDSPELDRNRTTAETAETLRRIMRRCRVLLFLAGPNAPASKWMPWELGFFDGRQGDRRIGLYFPEGMAVGPEHQEYLDLYQRVTDSNLGAFLAGATDDTAAMTGATLDHLRRHAERMMTEPVDYWLSALQWWYGVSANMLLDPARATARGDGQPEGPLREPEAMYRPTYEALRSMQANLAQWRKQLGDASPRGKRLGIAPAMPQWPGLPGGDPMAVAVNVAVTGAVNPGAPFVPVAGINGLGFPPSPGLYAWQDQAQQWLALWAPMLGGAGVGAGADPWKGWFAQNHNIT
jgi:hypothetical protein